MSKPQIILPPEIAISDKRPRTAIAIDRTSGVKQQSDTAREILIIGQMVTGSSGTALTPTKILRETDAEVFGVGSPVDIAAKAAFLGNPNATITAIAIADAGTKATATITIATTATATGEVYFFIMGRKVTLSVTSGDTPTTQGTNLAAAINARTDLPVTAGAAAGVVTLTAKVGGTLSNTITLRTLTAFGFVPGSTYTLSGAVMGSAVAGSGAVSTTGATAVAASRRYNIVMFCLDDQTSEQALRDFCNAQGLAEIGFGQIGVTAQVNTVSSQTTQALAVNGLRSVHLSINGTESWFVEIAGTGCGVISTSEMPTRPMNALILPGIKAPPVEKRWIVTERRTLLDNGCTPLIVDPGENVTFERVVSTNVTNTAGNKDYSVLDITKIQGLDYTRDNIKLMMDTSYQRALWADDDPNTGLPPEDMPAEVATPSKVTGDIVTVLHQLEATGIVSNVDALKSQIVVNKVGTQCQFSVPAQIVDGLHEKLGKVVYIFTPFGQ